MRIMRGRRSVMLFALLVTITAGILTRPFLVGLSFVVRAAGLRGFVHSLASIGTRAETEQAIDIPTGAGPIHGRLYWPDRAPRRVTLLVSGLHPAGIDEPRLVQFARQLAASGMAVVTPDIPGLSTFEITPRLTDTIGATARWMTTMPAVTAGDGRIGMVGISFSGGLSLVAAGRSEIRNNVAFVVSVGGHDDLPRVLHYLCTGTEPYPRQQVGGQGQPFVRAPHDYGVAVILLGVADRLVPAGQVDRLKAVVREFLVASALDAVNHDAATREFMRLRELPKTLPEPSATLVRQMNDRDVIHLGATLLPYIGLYGGDPGLSVSHSPKPSAQVFLLHGLDDNVIPTIESEYLADDLRGHTSVRLLLSQLFMHTTVDREVRAADVFQLADFWGDILSR
jgi:dienelactone hydrolase